MSDSKGDLSLLTPEAKDFLTIIDKITSLGEIDDYEVLGPQTCLVLTKSEIENEVCEPMKVARVFAFHYGQVGKERFSCLLQDNRPDRFCQHDIKSITWAGAQERASGVSLKVSLETSGENNMVTTFRFDLPRSGSKFPIVADDVSQMLAKTAKDFRDEVRQRLFSEWADKPAMKSLDCDDLIPDDINNVAHLRTHVPYQIPSVSEVLSLRTGVACFLSSHQSGVDEGRGLMCRQVWFITPDCYLINQDPKKFRFRTKVEGGNLQLLAVNPDRAIVEIGYQKQVLRL